MQSSHRRSRKTRTRTGKSVELCPRDIEIFKLLARYRYLRSTTIHAFVGGASEARFKDRITRLFHEGFIDRPEQQWQFSDCLHTPVVHEIGDGGRRSLRALGLEQIESNSLLSSREHRQFLHCLMICETMAAIELCVRDRSHVRLITWQEILSKAPKGIRASEHPFQFPVSIASPGDPESVLVTTSVEPDAIFGVEYEISGVKSYRFFAVEADRETMPVWRSNLNQSSYLKKLLGYRDLIARRLHDTRLGLPNLLVLTVTPTEERSDHIRAELAKLAGASAPFLFKSVRAADGPSNHSPQKFMQQPWTRVGHPPVRIEDPES